MASLLLGDLNDYIQPTVACSRPIEDPKASESPSRLMEINLNDCLACSGCVTTAETVLISEQTHQQLSKTLEENAGLPLAERRIIVVSICASTRAALARRYSLPPLLVHKKLSFFFRQYFEAQTVLDVSFANLIYLKTVAEEFLERYGAKAKPNCLPMMSSDCPGWVCYVEKKQPRLIPHLCTVRSPQQITGALVKTFFADAFAASLERTVRPRDIFHVSVMSCYDKKLEASRDDFMDEEKTRDVDCVITSSEIITLIDEKVAGNFGTIPDGVNGEYFPSVMLDPTTGEERLVAFPGGSDGGCLFFVLRYAAEALFGIKLSSSVSDDSRVTITHYRGNIDYTEYCLESSVDPGAPPLLRFAAISGFRNIQTFVQKCKTKKIEYDFVEVMACPGACLFGGGQPAAPGQADRMEFRKGMEALLYEQTKLVDATRVEDPVVASALSTICDWIESSPERRALLYTGYRSLESVKKKAPILNVMW